MSHELERLKSLFERIDAETGSFARASGLACPPGCGACCLSPEVEATELEMDVLAEHLADEGLAEVVLERIDAVGEAAPCVIYQPQPGHPERGRCGHYAQRPTLCRLFAFAAVRGKSGKPQLAACHVHRETQPEAAAAAARAVEQSILAAPLYTHAASELLSIDPERGAARMPINQALKRALQRSLLRRALRSTGVTGVQQ
jgi:Fe-S-cluster containining protein